MTDEEKIRVLEADNAELLKMARNAAAGGCDGIGDGCGECMGCLASALAEAPHPGAVLLAQMEKDREAIRALLVVIRGLRTVAVSQGVSEMHGAVTNADEIAKRLAL